MAFDYDNISLFCSEVEELLENDQWKAESFILFFKDEIGFDYANQKNRDTKSLRKTSYEKSLSNFTLWLKDIFGDDFEPELQSCWITNSVHLNVDSSVILRLKDSKRDTNVFRVELDKQLKFQEPQDCKDQHNGESFDFWNRACINLPDDFHLTGKGVICAVIDQNFSINHVDINNSIIGNKLNKIRSFRNQNPVHRTNSGVSGNHGTACASLIAGTKTGLAKNAKILAIHVDNYESSLCRAIALAISSGAKVISCSLNFYRFFGEAPYADNFRDALSRYVFQRCNEEGVIFVNSAGNDYSNAQNPKKVIRPSNYPPPYLDPLHYPNNPMPGAVLTVGAVGRGCDARIRESSVGPIIWDGTYYSDFPLASPLIKPDIMAPGQAVDACKGAKTGYYKFCLTSAAAPQVAGAICLLIEEINSRELPILPDKIQLILEQSATKIQDSSKNNHTGAGVLNVGKAHEELLKLIEGGSYG